MWCYDEKKWWCDRGGLRVELDSLGCLVETRCPQGALRWHDDSWRVEFVDKASISTTDAVPSIYPDGEALIVRSAMCDLSLEVRHVLTDQGFYQRSLTIFSERAVAIAVIHWQGAPSLRPLDFVEYQTFWNAPTCAFARFGPYGLALGMENPFFQAGQSEHSLWIEMRPGIVLRSGEAFQFEPLFLMTYAPFGRTITNATGAFLPSKREGIDRYRFRNPCGHVPIDLAEISVMRNYIESYLDIAPRAFAMVLYMYWYPIEQMPRDSALVAKYRKLLDNFAALGGEWVIFNPMHPYSLPEGPDGLWNLAPEGSGARQVLNYARALGLKCGAYMGVATHGRAGNASALPFRPEMSAWKKLHADGSEGTENCLAADGYLGWWLDAQVRTIESLGLDIWTWDPGPGNAAHCHSDAHGHLPGQGAYLGFRSSQRLLRALRERFPRLYLMSYYGRKEYGPWGFKYFDQQEGYWEQTLGACASLHPDMHDDRVNAHGVRLQNAWNQLFRFLPPQINHALVHRIGEHYYPPDTVRLWDQGGWQFALLSAVCASGSITLCLMPGELDDVPGMAQFYRRWVRWARDNQDTLPYAVPIGGQVEAGRFDGVARIKGRRGAIFLFNSAPIGIEDGFALDGAMGFDSDQPPVGLRMLYPHEGAHLWNSDAGCGTFRCGDHVPVRLAPYEAQVWAFVEPEELPLVFGIPGRAALCGDVLTLCPPPAEAGTQFEVVTGCSARALRIGEVEIPLVAQPDGSHSACAAAGPHGALDRAIVDWCDEEGNPFPLLDNPARERVTLTASLTFEPELSTHVAELATRQDPDLQALAERYLYKREGDLFHNYLWAMPGRAHLLIHTRTQVGVRQAQGTMDGAPLAFEPFTLDGMALFWYAPLGPEQLAAGERRLSLTLDGLQAGQFLGAHLDVAPYPCTRTFSAADPATAYVAPRTECAVALPSPFHITAASLAPDQFPATGGKAMAAAALDADQADIECVYIENATQPSLQRMGYDERSGQYRAEVVIGERARNIMDAERFHVWARDSQGRYVDPVTIPFRFVGAETLDF